MGMTMTQKILAAHAGLDSVTAGQLIEAKLDVVMANDITGPMALPIFRQMADKVFDKDKVGPAHKILTYSFWFYNKGGALLKKHKRTLKGKIENPATPIDPIEIPYLHNIKKQK